VIDGGLSTAPAIPFDTFDVDDDADLGERTPDRDRKPRVRGLAADMGSYERYAPDECTGDVNGDGMVDIDDLLLVIGAWGPCPVLPDLCNANISGVSGNVVDIDDLLAVIGTWGPCPDNSGLAGSTPQSVQDCMDKCEDAGLSGQEWADCVDECVQALCAAGIIACD
jgi:hypothetical protein